MQFLHELIRRAVRRKRLDSADDFRAYYGPGIIALDACTAHSGKVNVIAIEDDDLPDQDAEDERFWEVTQRILEEHKAAFIELAK